MLAFARKSEYLSLNMLTVEAPTATLLPSGVSPAPEVVNHDNQSGVIAIITAFSLGLILLSACMKLYARKYFRKFRHDDITFALAIVSPQTM